MLESACENIDGNDGLFVAHLATAVLLQSNLSALNLSGPCFSTELRHELMNLTKTSCANGMAFAFKTT